MTDPARLATAAIHAALARGAAWQACDEFNRASASLPPDTALLHAGALAHARAGAPHAAHSLLDRAERTHEIPRALRGEMHALRGRLWKDALHAGDDPAVAAMRARDAYAASWSLAPDPYPGINAATLSWILGDLARARELAAEVRARLPASRATVWDHATAGEAALLLGDIDDALAAYAEAARAAPDHPGSLASVRRQLHLLAPHLPAAADALALLPAPVVAAFAGHLLDAPGRVPARFPAALEPAVAAAVHAKIAGWHAPVFYGSAASGADLVVIEAALARRAEVNVVLPFAREDFIRSSVAPAGPAWVTRFEAALARATRVVDATQERHLGDDVLFEHAARLVEGLTVLRAAQLEVEPRLLCIVDRAAAGSVGGTASSIERWAATLGAPEIIDLRALRAAARPYMSPPQGGDAAIPRVAPASAAAPGTTSVARRSLKTMVFADIAGYGRLADVHVAPFQTRFWALAADAIARANVPPLVANTWGDALHLVFEQATDAADVALDLAQAFARYDWTALGLAIASPLRISLHTGPVYGARDPVTGRDNYFGSSVTLAARIEPVTPPGSVFASEACAATLAASSRGRHALEYLGMLDLAKGANPARVYRVAARAAPRPL
ncbi:MAG: hypothetical protein JSR18_12860 [Proteobacteria bacterium]|nr:hypothetical protein [Pseudomonadota bacterium]